jgi:hypothetical protein
MDHAATRPGACKPRFYDGPRMSDLAAGKEAACVAEALEDDLRAGRTVLGFQGWTHSPARLASRSRLLDALAGLRETGTAVALQVTWTGLGGTVLEPGIGPPAGELEALRWVLERIGAGFESVCARIDPLQRFAGADGGTVSNLEEAADLLTTLASAGIRRFRTSAIDFRKYRSKIEPRAAARDLRHDPPGAAEIEAACLAMARAAAAAGAELKTCACPLPGLEPGACFDPAWLRSLCRLPEAREDALWRPEVPVAPRTGCLCASPREARMRKIPARGRCFGGCAACYAQGP